MYLVSLEGSKYKFKMGGGKVFQLFELSATLSISAKNLHLRLEHSIYNLNYQQNALNIYQINVISTNRFQIDFQGVLQVFN